MVMESFISWIGGKKALRRKIVEEFPEKRDVQPIRGSIRRGWMGAFLFGKTCQDGSI